MITLCEQSNLASHQPRTLAMGLLTGKYPRARRACRWTTCAANATQCSSYFKYGKPHPEWLKNSTRCARSWAATDGAGPGGAGVAVGAHRADDPDPASATVAQVEENCGAIGTVL